MMNAVKLRTDEQYGPITSKFGKLEKVEFDSFRFYLLINVPSNRKTLQAAMPRKGSVKGASNFPKIFQVLVYLYN